MNAFHCVCAGKMTSEDKKLFGFLKKRAQKELEDLKTAGESDDTPLGKLSSSRVPQLLTMLIGTLNSR